MYALDIEDDYYRQYSLFYLTEGRQLDSGSIHGVSTYVSYKEHSTIPYQDYTMSPAVTVVQLRAALTKTVKLITSINDVVILFYYFARGGLNSTYKNITSVLYVARLPESKSAIALKRLNSISDKMFASNVSMFLGVPVTVKTYGEWYVFNWKYPGSDYSTKPFLTPLVASKYKRMSFRSCTSIHQSTMVFSGMLCCILQFST